MFDGDRRQKHLIESITGSRNGVRIGTIVSEDQALCVDNGRAERDGEHVSLTG